MKVATAGFFIALIVITGFVVAPWAMGDYDGDGIINVFDPIYNPDVPLKGEVYPYVQPYAADDTTDIDGAGTYEFWRSEGTLELYEPALTWGTNTHTTIDYQSGQTFYFVCKSTTANAFDHYSWKVTLPTSSQLGENTKDSLLYQVEWDSVNEKWDIHFYVGQEAQPTLLAYTPAGVEVGTTAQDLSNRDYVLTFNLKIAIAANYDCLSYFFDPAEGENGQWDHNYLILTCNISAANAGWTIDSPWKLCSDGKSYYLDLQSAFDAASPTGTGLVVRWDENQWDGVVELSLTIRSSDIDTSGAGAALFTLNYKECQGPDEAYYQTWEADTLTNLAGAVTAETIVVQD